MEMKTSHLVSLTMKNNAWVTLLHPSSNLQFIMIVPKFVSQQGTVQTSHCIVAKVRWASLVLQSRATK